MGNSLLSVTMMISLSPISKESIIALNPRFPGHGILLHIQVMYSRTKLSIFEIRLSSSPQGNSMSFWEQFVVRYINSVNRHLLMPNTQEGHQKCQS